MTADSKFVWVSDEDLQKVSAPTADHYVEPDKRVQGYAYECGVIELRSARPGEHLNSTHGIVNLRDHR